MKNYFELTNAQGIPGHNLSYVFYDGANKKHITVYIEPGPIDPELLVRTLNQMIIEEYKYKSNENRK